MLMPLQAYSSIHLTCHIEPREAEENVPASAPPSVAPCKLCVRAGRNALQSGGWPALAVAITKSGARTEDARDQDPPHIPPYCSRQCSINFRALDVTVFTAGDHPHSLPIHIRTVLQMAISGVLPFGLLVLNNAAVSNTF